MNKNVLLLVGISIMVPAIVAALFLWVQDPAENDSWLKELPVINASLNATSFITLITGFFLIRQGREKAHKNAMLTAFALGGLFLISYLIYHSQVPSTLYGDVNHDGILSDVERMAVGEARTIYLIVLISHILMAIAGLPLVLMALYFGLKNQRKSHKRIVHWAYPVWLYVSITGVIVYFLISPYY